MLFLSVHKNISNNTKIKNKVYLTLVLTHLNFWKFSLYFKKVPMHTNGQRCSYFKQQAVGARRPNFKFTKSSRAAVLVLVVFKKVFGFSLSHTKESFTFIDFNILNNF